MWPKGRRERERAYLAERKCLRKTETEVEQTRERERLTNCERRKE